MYGLIHQAARDLAVARLGQDEWQALLARSALSERNFIGMRHNSDADTLRLVDLIAEKLGSSLGETLFAFGKFWFEFAENSSYGRVIRMAGGDLETFVGNLDRMHASIGSNMPDARPPCFELVTRNAKAIRMLYRSEREGYAPFLHGILTAAAERFGERVRVTYDTGPDGVLFVLTRRGRRPASAS